MSNADKIVNHTFLKVYLRKKFILDFFCDFKLQSIGHKSLENFFVLHIQTDKSDSSLTKCCCVNGFLSHTFWCSWPIQNWNCSQLRMSNMVLASSLRRGFSVIIKVETVFKQTESFGISRINIFDIHINSASSVMTWALQRDIFPRRHPTLSFCLLDWQRFR